MTRLLWSRGNKQRSREMEGKYTFVNANRKKFPGYDSKEMQDLLLKWSMKDRICIQAYCFNEPFHIYHRKEFVEAFFRDETVASTLFNINLRHEWTPVGVTAESVEIEQVSCSVISMDFFDRLKEPGKLVTGKGHLKKSLGEQINGFEVWDELRRMLLDEESKYWDLYSPVERDEFIFRILFHLCLGGELCQYEDDLEPYLKATKLLYKDVISVAKDPETQQIVPTSLVFKAVAKTKNGQSYFPFDEDNPQNFCYLIIDPVKRVVTVIIHQFGSSF